MGRATLLTAPVLEQFLIQACLTKAAVSLRLQGAGSRLLGDMRLQTFHPGSSLQLSGLNARDSVPPEGMQVTLTILLGEEVLTLESRLLAPLQDESGNTLLHLEWPRESARRHTRRDVRVAAPDQSPLKVQMTLGSHRYDALLMNLTETGVGLALQEALLVDLHTSVEIDAELPDGTLLRCPAEVRHLAVIDGQDYPTRLGLVLTPGPETDLESVHRFIQVRRTDRSQSFRRS